MARQSSFIKLEGTIGDVTFYKGKNGYKARQKGGVSKERILNDPAYERTRENLAEFARAASAAKLLKDAFREITLRAHDTRTHNRLYSHAVKIIKTDLISNRGKRLMENGDNSLFTGFQFSVNSMFEATVFASYTIVDNGSNIVVTFDSFTPSKYLAKPPGATDFRFFLVSAGVEFATGIATSGLISSPESKLDSNTLSNLALSLPKPNSGTHRYYALGVEFLQEVNGKMYPLNNGAFNAAKIILTETV